MRIMIHGLMACACEGIGIYFVTYFFLSNEIHYSKGSVSQSMRFDRGGDTVGMDMVVDGNVDGRFRIHFN